MFDEVFEVPAVSAADAREHVIELEQERAIAERTGVATIATYIDDLDWELDAWRRVYLISAVTEIATLRAQLDGILSDD